MATDRNYLGRKGRGAAHDEARALGEQAPDDLALGREQVAGRHAAEAKRLDPDAVRGRRG